MNKDKSIKDLQERNDKLKSQYEIMQIRNCALEQHVKSLEKRNKELENGFKSATQELCEYAEENERTEGNLKTLNRDLWNIAQLLNLEEGSCVEDILYEIEALKELISIRESQLEEMQKSKRDYTQENILEMEKEKYKSIIKEVREYCNNRMNYFNEMRRDYFEVLEEADIENILEILDKENV